MSTATELLLEANGVSKAYGAVVALRDASLAVRRGEIHALMGANCAGKSTFVKILTGAVRPDAGTIVVAGKERLESSPAEARRHGVVSVYQEPSLIPDLDIRSNLRLTDTPLDAFRQALDELGLVDRADAERHALVAGERDVAVVEVRVRIPATAPQSPVTTSAGRRIRWTFS
jgi:ribose transport system ATP-binding protein